MTLPVLLTSADPHGVDVALEPSFTAYGFDDTATLELNPGSLAPAVQAELTRNDARALRDALDRLLGETRATVPFTDEDNANPTPQCGGVSTGCLLDGNVTDGKQVLWRVHSDACPAR